MRSAHKPHHALTPRAAAAQWLAVVLGERRTLDDAISAHPPQGSDIDQKFARALTLTVLRHGGQLDQVIAGFLDKPLPAKRLTVMNALRLGAAQLLVLETPAHAAVNETVAMLKKGKDAGFAGLVNAVLQRIVREQPPLPHATANLPPFFRTRWEHFYGSETVAAIAEVAASRPPLDLHTARGMEGGRALDGTITRLPPQHSPVESLPGYQEGAFFVQDIAASYPVRLLGDVRERQVLDLCAAPGGKGMQLARAGAFVTALDDAPARMRRMKSNFARMKLSANFITADMMTWEPTRAYDTVLLDAPCTATGTWRRHPEVLHLVGDENIMQRSALQRTMLTRAWNWVKPGGMLVYCVCSLEPEEGEAQAAWFLDTVKERAKIVPPPSAIPVSCLTPEGYLRTLPNMLSEQGGMDGFFAVCWEKI